ncbi:PREDICTED: lysosomal thioesterase PPT2-A-like [Amphimedon queenslandica]|uniref:palmitoyl-CoA hydrolase n=1 Tax=Amphimedon queenslandica TaxID=400682 RepID=A0A1X7VPS6_AMPQE|nr:PREDICTED: lysosomal thioesterase PPT2-A-like [Amphimedon queenslandica]|eukprot:XP_003383295.1 PREDICTED: lysosomal thioesterase PPT2-A-like [Amphimedon queenslandica]
MLRILLAVFVLFSSVRHSVSYRPVIVMHGVLAGASDMDSFVSMIKTAHPGTEVTDISDYNDANSLVNMNDQVKGVYSKMKPVMDAAKDGVNLVCYSQGGLVCRGVLEKYGHNVHTFISLSSPQAGQFGDTDYLNFLFPTFTRDNIYLFFYTDAGQEISVGNYWNDPFHHSDYLSKNKFLPSITNNAPQEYKDNILKLQQVVFIGGPDDGVITPWQSSHFGFYKEKSDSEIVTMTEQEYYTNDVIGLQTLNNAGKIKVYEIPGVEHTHWHTNQTVFNDAIIQWLD